MVSEMAELSTLQEDDNKTTTKSIDTKLNKSVYFLLPMIGLSLGSNLTGLLNCYLGDVNDLNLDEYKNFHLFLLMKEPNIKLRSMVGFVRQYRATDGIMYIFRIPAEYEDDYLKFILGKYSEFSNNYKAQVYKLLNKPYRDGIIYQVLNKSANARKIIEEKVGQSIGDQEVMSIPDMNKEIYG